MTLDDYITAVLRQVDNDIKAHPGKEPPRWALLLQHLFYANTSVEDAAERVCEILSDVAEALPERKAVIGDLVEFRDNNRILWRGILVDFDTRVEGVNPPRRCALIAVTAVPRLLEVWPEYLTVTVPEFYSKALAALIPK